MDPNQLYYVLIRIVLYYVLFLYYVLTYPGTRKLPNLPKVTFLRFPPLRPPLSRPPLAFALAAGGFIARSDYSAASYQQPSWDRRDEEGRRIHALLERAARECHHYVN